MLSPDGKNLVFTSEVYPVRMRRVDDACNKKRGRGKGEQGEGPDLYGPSLPPLDRWQGIAPQPCPGDCRVAGGSGPGPDAGHAGRAAVFAGRDRTTISIFARNGKELCYAHEHRSGRSTTSTDSDFLRGLRWRADEPVKITTGPGADADPALFARRKVHRLARATAAGL